MYCTISFLSHCHVFLKQRVRYGVGEGFLFRKQCREAVHSSYYTDFPNIVARTGLYFLSPILNSMCISMVMKSQGTHSMVRFSIIFHVKIAATSANLVFFMAAVWACSYSSVVQFSALQQLLETHSVSDKRFQL